MSVKIKICDVRTVEDVELCAKHDVDFIGIHQINAPISSEKHCLLDKVKSVSQNMKIVLVTKECNLDKLIDMCLSFDWDYIQLHTQVSLSFINDLKNELAKHANRVPGIIAVIQADQFNENKIKNLYSLVDYILFDSSWRGGTGETSSDVALDKIQTFCKGINYFVAGGLTPDNVQEMVYKSKPFAVDVQSGVEYSSIEKKHQKDPKKIKAFVAAVRNAGK